MVFEHFCLGNRAAAAVVGLIFNASVDRSPLSCRAVIPFESGSVIALQVLKVSRVLYPTND